MENFKRWLLTFLGIGFLFEFKDTIELLNIIWENTRGLPQYYAELSTGIIGSLTIIAIAKLSRH